MSGQVRQIASPVGVIAGAGAMPVAVAAAMSARGLVPILLALKGVCDAADIARFRHHWVGIGQFGRMLHLLDSERCRDLVMIGHIVRPALSDIRLDWRALREMPAIIAAFRGGDDHLLSGVGRIWERACIRLGGIADVAPELLMPLGRLTKMMPDGDAQADIARGRAVHAALGPFDVGQGVVVIDDHCVAVEDIEGTDALLARVARLRAEGRLRARTGRGVLVKAPKPGQDLRMDLPTIGPRTVEGVAAAGLAGLAVAAGQSILAEPQAMIAAADRAGVFVMGLPA